MEINKVAIYLRKSRQEEGMSDKETLYKHRGELVALVESNDWNYDIYQEVGTSQNIKFRTEFSKLLERIKSGLYDAIVVIDLARISRGSESMVIFETFKERNIKIITPSKIYDLNNESDEMLIEAESFGNRLEYRFIKRRLNEGKKRSARLGQWSNGTTPIGYDYDRNTKKLTINEDEAKIIRLIYRLYLDGKSMQDISFELNRRGIKTRRNAFYHEATIGRILRNEVYIGTIIYGKTEGSGHKNKKTKPLRLRDESEWIRVENAHQPIIDRKIFNDVQYQMSKRNVIPDRAKQGVFTTSGIMYCGKCKKMISYRRRTLADDKEVAYIHSCRKPDEFGNRCDNKSSRLEPVLSAIYEHVMQYENQLFSMDNKLINKESIRRIKNEMSVLQGEIKRINSSFSRIKKLYIEGMINEEEMKQESSKMNKKLKNKKNEYRTLENKLSKKSNEANEIKIKNIEKLKDRMNPDNPNPFDNEVNRILRELIHKIYYERNGDEIELNIEFL